MAYGETVAPYSGADANGDGLVNDMDQAIWRSHYGHTFATAPASALIRLPFGPAATAPATNFAFDTAEAPATRPAATVTASRLLAKAIAFEEIETGYDRTGTGTVGPFAIAFEPTTIRASSSLASSDINQPAFLDDDLLLLNTGVIAVKPDDYLDEYQHSDEERIPEEIDEAHLQLFANQVF